MQQARPPWPCFERWRACLATSCGALTPPAWIVRGACEGVIVDNADMATGMEKKEIDGTADIFWSREPIMGPKGTKENPAIVPSFNTSRVVGLETEQARALLVLWSPRRTWPAARLVHVQ